MSAGEPKSVDEAFPRVLTRKDLRFEISFALSQVAKATVWEWARTDRLKKEAARERIIDTVAARFDRLEVRAPAPIRSFGDRFAPSAGSDGGE